jgi:cytochrome c peroxidase
MRAPQLWGALATLGLSCGLHSVPAGPPADALSPEDWAQLQRLSPPVLPPAPVDLTNRYADDPDAARLGQHFFMDPLFAGRLLDGDNDGTASALGRKGQTGKVSCAGCHVPTAGFIDDRTLNKQISLASGWNLRRSPSVLDVGQARIIMWDGRHDALYNQVFGPIENPLEMNSSRLFVALQIAARYRSEYEAVFGPMPDVSRWPVLDALHTGCDRLPALGLGACHGMPGDHAEYDGLSAVDQDAVTRIVVNFGKAIGAYERLLSCGPGRFDRWMRGEATAITPAEQRGAALFVGKARCNQCHQGPYLSDQRFHNVGLRPTTVAVVFTDTNDRGAFTGLASSLADPLNTRGAYSDADDRRLYPPVDADEGSFRTPILRCVARHPSFMHTGQLTSLAEVIQFFDVGGHSAGYPGKSELEPLGLSMDERSDLVSFLGTLEGEGPAKSLLEP